MNKKYIGYGAAALGLGYIAYYIWGLTTIKDRAQVTKVDIVDVGLTWIKLQLTITNFSTISIPFNGASGTVKAQGYQLVNFSVNPSGQSLDAGSVTYATVQGNINWAQLAALIPNVVNLISSGQWQQVITQLQPTVVGTIYSGNFSADFDLPLV